MKLSEIKAFLEKQIAVEEFKKEIASEVNNFKRDLAKKGGTTPIYLEEDCELFIGAKEAILILHEYKQNRFDEYYVSYIVDALLLSEKVGFESEEFLELFETLTDPEINGSLSLVRVNELLRIFEENSN